VDIKQKIKSLIRNAIFKALAPDGSHQNGDFTFLGVEQRGVIYSPYGLYSNPKKGSFAVLLQSGAKEDSIVGLVWNPKDKPDLPEGGVALQSDGGKMSVICYPDGKIEIKGETQEMVAVLSSALGNIKSYSDAVNTLMSGISAVAIPNGGKLNVLYANYDADVANMQLLASAIDADKTNLDTMKK
jgi:hypothetical protein